jgi:alkylhydroperoxidase/carboxymuconolactone decarboxylase family protein YurZ
MTTQPTVDQVLANMTAAMGSVPDPIRAAAQAMPEMVLKQAQDSGWAMPAENGALSAETRTLIYLGIALATGGDCVKAMTNKAKAQGIDDAKLLETFKIARYAEATRVLGNATYLFDQIASNR